MKQTKKERAIMVMEFLNYLGDEHIDLADINYLINFIENEPEEVVKLKVAREGACTSVPIMQPFNIEYHWEVSEVVDPICKIEGCTNRKSGKGGGKLKSKCGGCTKRARRARRAEKANDPREKIRELLDNIQMDLLRLEVYVDKL